MADEPESRLPEKDAPRAKTTETDRMVPLGELSAPLRRLLEETPRKEWYRIKAVRASYQETVDLVMIVNALEHLLKVTPDRALRRVMDRQVEEGAFYAAFRGIRDGVLALREKCMALAAISGVEIKAWSDRRGRRFTPNPLKGVDHGPNGARPLGAPATPSEGHPKVQERERKAS